MQVTGGEIVAVVLVGLWFLARLAGSLHESWEQRKVASGRNEAGR